MFVRVVFILRNLIISIFTSETSTTLLLVVVLLRGNIIHSNWLSMTFKSSPHVEDNILGHVQLQGNDVYILSSQM